MEKTTKCFYPEELSAYLHAVIRDNNWTKENRPSMDAWVFHRMNDLDPDLLAVILKDYSERWL